MADDTALSSPFFANAVHELRTPIQTIIGTLELMEETHLDQEQTEYVRQTKFSADILLSLVNDLLDFSKLRSGKFKVERIAVNPAEVIESTVDLISIEAHNRGLEIVTDIDYSLPQSVYGDPTRLQQVLLNLTKNAVKFTSKGYVCVRLSKVDAENGEPEKLRYEVIDSGIGVPDDKKQLIFKDFVQADESTTRKFGGTGLGLSICKTITALMNGQIGIKDNPEGGSIFWVEIPLEICSDTSEAHTAIAKLDIPETARILIVDDQPLARKSLLAKLTALGAKNVDTVSNGTEALEKLRAAARDKSPYTLALIDMIMPVMDGWRLSSEINADRNINGTRLYMMVPEGQMGSEAKMRMLDWFNGYLYKPIKRHLLVDTINDGCKDALDLEVAKGEDIAAQKAKEVLSVNAAKEAKTASEPEKYTFGVLAAEDHPINQKLVKTFLNTFVTTVFTANNGAEAVQAVREHPEIRLIFMDIQMPEMNGVEATEELRAAGYDGIIIACTANSDESDFQLYRKSGMDDILVKPFKKTNLKALLDKWSPTVQPAEAEKSAAENEDPEEILELEELPAEENVDQAENKIIQVWDKDDFLDTVSGDKDLAVQLTDQFIDRTRTLLIKAKEAVYSHNFDEMAKIGHTLKGSSAALSAHTLSEAGKAMKAAAKASLPEETVKHLNEFSAEFSRFEFLANEQRETWKK
ncbi:MAG: response regulator [Treponemataceae bacterium]|nr:response regulator [Treponemataceae bacterium]